MHCTTITIPFQELAAAQEDSAKTQWYRTELHEQVEEVRHFKRQLLAVQDSRDGLQAQVAVLESRLACEALAAADSEALLRDATETAAHRAESAQKEHALTTQALQKANEDLREQVREVRWQLNAAARKKDEVDQLKGEASPITYIPICFLAGSCIPADTAASTSQLDCRAAATADGYFRRGISNGHLPFLYPTENLAEQFPFGFWISPSEFGEMV